jgi:hypothetical protein
MFASTTLKLLIVVLAVATQAQRLPSTNHENAATKSWHDTKTESEHLKNTEKTAIMHADGVVTETAQNHGKVAAKQAKMNSVANVEGGRKHTTSAAQQGLNPFTLAVIVCGVGIVLVLVGSLLSGSKPARALAAPTSSSNVELPTILPMTDEDRGSML